MYLIKDLELNYQGGPGSPSCPGVFSGWPLSVWIFPTSRRLHRPRDGWAGLRRVAGQCEEVPGSRVKCGLGGACSIQGGGGGGACAPCVGVLSQESHGGFAS